ncbi:helix-turn-helix domain-containing protein [Sphingomonas sp. NFR15]|uniref:helix-turn-helix domain-containing protein n=1 Tax=Sphingomonas sp. NFR15 TaxID=1566282 RepID=UPI000887ADDA|nr:AraC family transcriptional regulator [Sphingomonas sp. NFR15]SDA35957.1 Helix-turn-helix domain-containing protein [Sphingomonas sp. NFR15]
MSEPEDSKDYYRFVTGVVAARASAMSATVKVESLVRSSTGPIDWRFRQRDFALFWFRAGFHGFDVSVDGSQTRVREPGRRGLSLFPGDAATTGEFRAKSVCEYDVIFIDRGFVEGRSTCILDRELVGFDEPKIRSSLVELTSWKSDASFGLMSEGWALQTIARLTVALGEIPDVPTARGGLSPTAMRRIDEYVMANLHVAVGMKELAAIASLSVRHFARAFKQSTGATPARYIFDRRLDLAKRLLAETSQHVTEIALVCGFSHAQHLSNTFRRATGRTPTAFRRIVQGAQSPAHYPT